MFTAIKKRPKSDRIDEPTQSHALAHDNVSRARTHARTHAQGKGRSLHLFLVIQITTKNQQKTNNLAKNPEGPPGKNRDFIQNLAFCNLSSTPAQPPSQCLPQHINFLILAYPHTPKTPLLASTVIIELCKQFVLNAGDEVFSSCHSISIKLKLAKIHKICAIKKM